MLIFLTSTLVAVIVSFLCSLAEAVLLSLNPIQLESLKQQGRAKAHLWVEMRRNIGRPIAAILILNTVAHTGGATIAGGAFDEIYGDEWIWLFSVLFTIVILFGTEIIPKVIGVAYNIRLAPWIAPILQAVILILRPIIFLTEAISSLFQGKRKESTLSRDDIEALARAARMYNIIEAEQENMIINAVKLRETPVERIMIPRDWIIFLRADQSFATNFDLAKNNFHTRYPISRSASPDDIMGYVNFKEMIALTSHPGEVDLTQISRPILSVKGSTNLNTMMKLLTGHRHHLALVLDSQDRMIGMVTLEDVIEEIVGEIEDEFDVGPAQISSIEPGSWQAGGGVRMASLARAIGSPVGDEMPEEMLSRWLQKRITKPLVPGMSCMAGELKLTVLQVRRGKAHQVRIDRLAGDGQKSAT